VKLSDIILLSRKDTTLGAGHPAVSIGGQDPFHSFSPAVRNNSQFKKLNLIQKLDDCLKKLINIIE
jgi:hypothetical protein